MVTFNSCLEYEYIKHINNTEKECMKRKLDNIVTLMQIPQPMHNVSEMKASFEVGITSIQSFPTKKILLS